MLSAVKLALRNVMGIEVRKVRTKDEPPRTFVPDHFLREYEKYKNYTMVPWTSLFSAYNAVLYADEASIPGAIVECGVYKGGCAAIMSSASPERPVHLFDTFEGMAEPGEFDVRRGKHARDRWMAEKKDGVNEWCYGPIDGVRALLPKAILVQGKVEDTLPLTTIKEIAVLRLDTDWYSSTKAELEYLYDRVSPGGVIILDDYGVWDGARKAADEFLPKGLFFTFDCSYGAKTLLKPR